MELSKMKSKDLKMWISKLRNELNNPLFTNKKQTLQWLIEAEKEQKDRILRKQKYVETFCIISHNR